MFLISATSKDYFSQINFLIITLFSIKVFISLSLLRFYLFFELTLIPIIIIILGRGYQPERLPATLALFFYTIFGSMPLLRTLIKFLSYRVDNLNQLSFFIHFSSYQSLILALRCSLAFLIKLPMFLAHIWLPKAHVEAPVTGSIYLAAVLLKLGGCGIIRFIRVIPLSNSIMLVIIISLRSLV